MDKVQSDVPNWRGTYWKVARLLTGILADQEKKFNGRQSIEEYLDIRPTILTGIQVE